MVTTHIELTLQQLLQIALGCPKISSVHLSLLQSFFDIILKKLDCKNEKVEIEADTSACLQEILRHNRISPYPFESDEISIIPNNNEREQQLKVRLNIIQTKLEHHLAELRKCNATLKGYYRAENWSRFADACESLCLVRETEKTLTCKLSECESFIMKLIATAVIPIIHEMNSMRTKMQTKHKQLLDFQKYFSEESSKVTKMYKQCIISEKLRQDFEKEKEIFTQTINEIYEMMLAKSKRVESSLMKKYLQIEVKSLENELDKISLKLDCRIPERQQKSIVDHQCLSCLGPILCHKVPVTKQTIAQCLDSKVQKKRHCSGAGPCISNDGQKYISNVYKLREQQRKEQKEQDKMDTQLKGSAGDYYKKGLREMDKPSPC